MKHRPTEPSITKNQILQWVNATLNGNETKIQSLGNGVVYCMLMNHYFPNSVPNNKIIMIPRNNMDNKMNLKKLQEALLLQNIKPINFDIFRVSEMSYLDNWQLVTKLYRYFDDHVKNNEKDSQRLSHHNQSQQSTNPALCQALSQPQSALNLPKEVPKTPDFSTGLLTPMKGLKYFQENTKLRYESLKLMEQIKNIVKSQSQSDKIKVKILKRMLGLIEQESQQQEWQMKQLFSDCKQKQQVITID